MYRLLLLLAAMLLPLAAQTSSVQGTVSDSQGATVPNAVVNITNTETSAARKTVTTDSGTYSFVQLPPGNYRVEAQAPGFRTQLQQVQLQINVPLTLNIKMELGLVTETVSVEADAASVNTQNATVGSPFTQTQIRQLPLQTRNVVELLSLQPGVTSQGNVMGAKRDQNNVTLDGVDVNDNQSAGTSNDDRGFFAALPVPLDSVQEFRVTVAGQGADQGRSAGGQVALVTKSGSNQYHGSLYEFHRNVKTAANDWFSNRAGIPRENLIRNLYGASFGGKIIKDRAFFFFNWEERKDRSATAQSRAVPTETMKAGTVRFRMNNGQIGELNPQELKGVDPLGLGASQTMLDIMKQYPVGNDLAGGADRGLNFSLFRFNAPLTRNDRALVSKMDFNLDRSAKHTLMLRGTLADNSRDQVLAQFPGQDAAARNLDNSKGLAARYTAVISPTIVNVLSYGYTRLGIAQSGTPGPSITFGTLATLQNYTRGFGRFIPTQNLANDTTWMKGTHTVQYGINFRFIQNDRNSFTTSYPSYSFSRNTLRGLGSDITDSINGYIRTKYGSSSLALSEATQVTNAMGALLGLVNQYSVTYNFGRDGKAVPVGDPISRSFATKEYEFYVQDSWKVRKDLTLTYGLRYGSYQVPYEKNGVQVVPTVDLEQYFAERVGASMAGVSGATMPNASLTYALGGPVNNGRGWFGRDNNNWAPRFGFAYAPVSDSFWGRLFGKGSVIRGGAAMLYDRYGSDMVVNFDQSGSPGLATQVTQPRNTNFSDSARYTGGNLPTLPSAPVNSGFPYTPPTILGGFNSNTGVASHLVAPYSFLLNLSYARETKAHITVEVGYVGRMSRKGLLQQDFFQPLTEFKDPKSGQTWSQAAGQLRNYYEQGITPAQVKANPGIIPKVPFFENMFPGAAGYEFAGSPTANYFYTTYGTYAGSDLDALNDMDRERQSDGSCISVLGCNTFFPLQNAGMRVWVNANNSSYNAGTLVVRRPVSKGWGFDFNYTLAHSFDIQSTAESGAGAGGAVIQNSFNPKESYASSDFDIRHNITANTVVELPFGKGKLLFHDTPGWVNQFIGGWQASMLSRYRTAMPLSISVGGVYPTNYLNGSIAILKPGATMPSTGVQYNQNGAPSIFASTTATNSFYGQFPGRVGTRNIVRGAPLTNFDLSLGKTFYLPFEGHSVQFRAEAFNAFNNVNFADSSLSLTLSSPGTFGQFTSTATQARVMQFALRYEF
ncbi:TonB-dependent receptor [Paludibaculum fermentans]|uniref:TonB-dependent receptor n=1 Tax=Paludibaculum fermentans TaxID=1473598 RepID=A0A7S7NKZ0_PALFE|nr:TonB-dependent receptor [Paludibaculum fermentans]QOY85578.1 TonB-dependent receptor [Paludibaculum fermentans]